MITTVRKTNKLAYQPLSGQERFKDEAVIREVLWPSLTEVVQCRSTVRQQSTSSVCNVQTVPQTFCQHLSHHY